MNLRDLNFKKRALYTGLRPFLKDEELMEALLIWENRYVHQSKFSLRYFTADVARQMKREQDEKVMLLNLVVTMNKPESELLPDPSPALSTYKKAKVANHNTQSQPREIQAISLLINKWLELAKSPEAIDVGKFVTHNVERLNIDRDLQVEFVRWMQDASYKMQPSRIRFQDLRKLINLFYVGFSEYFGIKRTDSLLKEAEQSLKNNGGAVFADVFDRLL